MPVGGLPADLLAEGALAALLEERDEHERLSRAAARLSHDLHNGRWRLTRAVYDSYVEHTVRWLGSDVPRVSESSAWVLTEATESLWHAWQRNEGLHGRQTFWGADESLLLIGRRSSDRMVVLGARVGYLESRVLAQFRPVAESLGVRIALSDAAGRPVLGSSAAPDGQQSLRLGAETGLPWTLSAVSVQDPADAALTAPLPWSIASVSLETMETPKKNPTHINHACRDDFRQLLSGTRSGHRIIPRRTPPSRLQRLCASLYGQ